MSVLMILRVKGDATGLEKLAAGDPNMAKTIVKRAQSHGLIRHRFFATADEIIVVDEWPDEASFQKFFDASPEIGDMMNAAGVTTQPEITFARKLDIGDDVG